MFNKLFRSPLLWILAGLLALAACSANLTTTDQPTVAATPTQAASAENPPTSSTVATSFDTTAGIQAAQWAENVTITLGEDSFRYESDGYPSHELPVKFLIPKNVGSQPFSNDSLGDFNVVTTTEYLSKNPVDVTLTLHPTYADEVQQTSLGTIGYILSGARLFNDYENMERSVVALDDNITFYFDEAGHDHASFVDECNGHPLQNGSNYHYHGVPKCITAVVDVAGEHSHIIGVLRDGFPVYGNLGENGVAVTNADLDACSGHVGPTPEFSDGIYHYHLTEDEAPYSVDCYKGVVDDSTGDGTTPGGPPGPPGPPAP
jgi:hypothetical protein